MTLPNERVVGFLDIAAFLQDHLKRFWFQGIKPSKIHSGLTEDRSVPQCFKSKPEESRIKLSIRTINAHEMTLSSFLWISEIILLLNQKNRTFFCQVNPLCFH